MVRLDKREMRVLAVLDDEGGYVKSALIVERTGLNWDAVQRALKHLDETNPRSLELCGRGAEPTYDNEQISAAGKQVLRENREAQRTSVAVWIGVVVGIVTVVLTAVSVLR